MRKETQEFYNLYRLSKYEEDNLSDEEPLIGHVFTFHKHYPRVPSIKLNPIDKEGELEQLLKSRGSCREFSIDPIRLDDLSYLLSGVRINYTHRMFESRTYPSPGARFPIEIYPIVFNVEGIEPGAYHYRIDNNNLELLLKEDFREISKEIVSPFIKNPSVAIVMTSVIGRLEIKYGS